MADGDITVKIVVSGTTTDGQPIADYTESLTTSSIKSVRDFTMTVPTTLATLLQIVSGTEAGDTLDALNCVIIKNQDATNYITVGWLDTSAKSVYVKVLAGEFIVLMSDQFDADGAAGAAFAEFNSADTINVQANSSAVQAKVIAY